MKWLDKVERDNYGRVWEGLSIQERCFVCGQPDAFGECNHIKLSLADIHDLGGIPNNEEFTVLVDIAEDIGHCGVCVPCQEFRIKDCVYLDLENWIVT